MATRRGKSVIKAATGAVSANRFIRDARVSVSGSGSLRVGEAVAFLAPDELRERVARKLAEVKQDSSK